MGEEVDGAEVCGWGCRGGGMGWITNPGGGRWRISDTSGWGCWREVTGARFSTGGCIITPACFLEVAGSNPFSSSEDSEGEFEDSPPLSCCLNFACCSCNWWRRTKILGMVKPALKLTWRKSTHFLNVFKLVRFLPKFTKQNKAVSWSRSSS